MTELSNFKDTEEWVMVENTNETLSNDTFCTNVKKGPILSQIVSDLPYADAIRKTIFSCINSPLLTDKR